MQVFLCCLLLYWILHELSDICAALRKWGSLSVSCISVSTKCLLGRLRSMMPK